MPRLCEICQGARIGPNCVVKSDISSCTPRPDGRWQLRRVMEVEAGNPA